MNNIIMSSDDFELLFTPLSNPNLKALEYPFSYIGKKDIPHGMDCDYSLNEIYRGLLDEPPLDIGDFPKNISEYYWIEEGHNDGDVWYCICRLDNGIYVCYKATCCYTGFDVLGGMILYASRDKKRLFYEAMEEVDRKICAKRKAGLMKSNEKYEKVEFYDLWLDTPHVKHYN